MIAKTIVLHIGLFIAALLILINTPAHAQGIHDGGTVPDRLSWAYSVDNQSQGGINMWGNVQTKFHIDYASTAFYTDYYDPSEWTYYINCQVDLASGVANQQWSLQSNINTYYVHIYKYISLSSYNDNGINYNSMSASMSIRPSGFIWGSFYYDEWFDSQTGHPYANASFQLHGSFGPGAGGDAIGQPFVPEPSSLSAIGLIGIGALRRRHL